MNEDQLAFHSTHYCPDCTGGGDLYVKNTKKYMAGIPPEYYCKKCKASFIIERIPT